MRESTKSKKSERRVSLWAVLSLQGVVLVTVCSLFLCVVALGLLSRSIRSNVEQQMSLVLDSLGEQIDEVFTPYAERLDTFAIAAESGLGKNELDTLLRGYSEALGEGSSCYYATAISRFEKGGYYLDDTDWEPESEWIPQERGWWKDAVRGEGNVVFSEPYIDAQTAALCVTLSRAVYSRGKVIGVAAIDIYLKTLADILRRMDLGEGSFIMLVQNDGTIAADTSDANYTLKKVDEIGIPELPEILASNQKNASIIIEETEYFTQFILNQIIGCQIVAFIPKSVVYSVLYRTLSIMIAICVGFALFVTVITTITTRTIMKPLNTMVRFVSDFENALEGGSNDYSPRIKVVSHNEIGKLAESINLFISRLQIVMEQIRAAQEKEKAMSSKLFEESQNLEVSTKETAATSQDSSAAVKEIVATMEDSNMLSESISQKIKNVSGVANKTSADVTEGAAQIEENVRQLHEIFDANQQTIDGIKTLGEKIESIWDIVTLINNVADQAKIIAFNAELEASTAGEAGKSFRIVANEIRRLSDGIIDGTKEIKEKITEVQQSSDTLIATSKSGTEKINDGYENARGLGEKFESIKKSAEITAESAADISDIIQQQASASEQILIALKEIANGVESFTVAADNISNTAANVRKISEDLNSVS